MCCNSICLRIIFNVDKWNSRVFNYLKIFFLLLKELLLLFPSLPLARALHPALTTITAAGILAEDAGRPHQSSSFLLQSSLIDLSLLISFLIINYLLKPFLQVYSIKSVFALIYGRRNQQSHLTVTPRIPDIANSLRDIGRLVFD